MWPTPSDDRTRLDRRRDARERCDVVRRCGRCRRAIASTRRRDDIRERIAEARIRRVDPGVDRGATQRAPRAGDEHERRDRNEQRVSRAPPPQPPASARPPVEALGDRRRVAASEHDRDRTRAGRRRPAIDSRRCSFACARSRASRPLTMTSPTSPDVASRTGSRTPPTAGNDCSHVGSWITTGVTSQRSARSLSQMLGETASMKSETTKTKVPAGKLDACRTSARRQPSSDGRPGARAVGLVGPPTRSRTVSGGPGESHRGRPARWSTYASSPPAAAAARPIDAIAAAVAAGLSSHGSGGP